MSILDILYTTLIMPIQLVLETFFMVSYRLVGNPGIAIIVLSLVMNFLILPLYMRADKMQEHERDVEAKLHKGVVHIRKTFKGDEKMMMLQTYYRQNNYHPLDVFKGSVSLFLEIPFFIAAYQYLSHLALLDGVSFWFINDLGAPDGLLTLGGMHINVLPFVMTAINLATCLLFTRGMPAKTKLQLYVMATLFLVLLYNSPAGLVFYWTLNNVFSFVKTIFYKLKNPRQVLAMLAAIVGICVLVLGQLFLANHASIKMRILIIIVGLALIVPLVVILLHRHGVHIPTPKALRILQPSKKTYVASALFLVVLFGLLIPSAVISASPQEFFNRDYFVNPAWFIVSSVCLAMGTFLVWMSVFYWLTTPRYKALFQVAIIVLCGIAVIDYMLFGTNLGMLSSSLQYEHGLSFSSSDLLTNLAVIVVVAGVLISFCFKLPNQVTPVVAVVCAAMVAMSAFNIYGIERSVSEAEDQVAQYQAGMPSFTLDKEGHNVVVIMLDRAMNEFIPFIFNEFPELKQTYSGFTYYDNVVSYGSFTNYAIPAVFGGYEYTPLEMNKRSSELLVDKHNEALLMMPVLFAENGYDVTFCDPTYAGYQWIPDLSIFDGYDGITTYLTNGVFRETDSYKSVVDANMRNFFYFGLMKASPLFLQRTLYDDGEYNKAGRVTESTIQITSDDGLTATGKQDVFMDPYTTLQNLDTMTRIDTNEGDSGSFVIITNDITHEPMILQEPAYIPADEVNNTTYEAEHHDRFTMGDSSLIIDNAYQYKHYQTNVAALREIGTWLNYLKENGVYDNTRIIIVSDHGRLLDSVPSLHEYNYPLLMVKDFNATEFTTSSEFMTNADVPTLAMAGLITDPVNPSTGNPISDDAKYAPFLYVTTVIDSIEFWSVSENNGTTFRTPTWYTVHTDVRDPSNWEEVEEPAFN